MTDVFKAGVTRTNLVVEINFFTQLSMNINKQRIEIQEQVKINQQH